MKIEGNVKEIYIDLVYGCDNITTEKNKKKKPCWVERGGEREFENFWYSKIKSLRKGYVKRKMLGKADIEGLICFLMFEAIESNCWICLFDSVRWLLIFFSDIRDNDKKSKNQIFIEYSHSVGKHSTIYTDAYFFFLLIFLFWMIFTYSF